MTSAVFDLGQPSPIAAADPAHRHAVAEYFDASYYLAANPQLAAAGLDPLDHFLLHGAGEGRNPSRLFDVAYYLATNADVVAAGINPLLHYAWVGAKEGRLPQRPLDTERRHLQASLPPWQMVPHWAGAADRSAALTPAALSAALAAGAGRAGMVVSVSHDDYASTFGGVQNLISDEQGAYQNAGWGYLHVSPAAPLPVLAEVSAAGAFRIRLRLDGTLVGVVILQDLLQAVAALRGQGSRLEVVFHHLMGHTPELMAALPTAAGVRAIVWVHDFFTLCPSYALMRNDVRFCGGPPPASAACTICTFGQDRLTHLPRIRAFFEATRPLVLAPSATAMRLWLDRGGLAHSETGIRPLARLIMADGADGDAVPAVDKDAPLRVAHLGARVMHKGWIVFEDLALGLARDARYEFYHLGADQGAALPGCIRHVPVRVVPEQREAMIEAVAEHRIDVVVSWSTWSETFCFAVHEALAGGAFVVARSAAGNVWPAVQANAPAQGCAIDAEAELGQLFASGEILQRVAASRRLRGALLRGGGTADWVLQQPVEAHRAPPGPNRATLPRLKAERATVLADD